ncbi:hypothetical protein DQP56_00630 [Mycolicibacter senuensis]|uniref:Serine/threonine protein kinase n=2 Tax=Mycobacteriaceae TaxID=1762 RepID=A0A1X1YBP0_9MYCO|nr:hypothetical protein AWC16_19230 [Mycolicibacter longobardus]RAV04356.1 hypothetical protein DQP56_00630 [Mycolicibacter senuensis]
MPPRRDDLNMPPPAARVATPAAKDFDNDWRTGEYRRPPASAGRSDLVRSFEAADFYRVSGSHSKRKWIGWGAAGAAVLALAWLLWPSSDGDQAADEAIPPVPAAAPEDIAKLESLLPRGYPAGTCHPVPPKAGERAKLFCYRNTDPNGPSSATYALAEDKENLDALMAYVVDEGHAVVCPGNVQSPGPWRRTANLSQKAGVLMCGVPDDVPTVAWTNDSALLLGIVETPGPRPATLAKLYDWWSKHS